MSKLVTLKLPNGKAVTTRRLSAGERAQYGVNRLEDLPFYRGAKVVTPSGAPSRVSSPARKPGSRAASIRGAGTRAGSLELTDWEPRRRSKPSSSPARPRRTAKRPTCRVARNGASVQELRDIMEKTRQEERYLDWKVGRAVEKDLNAAREARRKETASQDRADMILSEPPPHPSRFH